MAVKPFEIPLTGGVNLLDDQRRIRDDEFVKTKNLAPVIKGMLSKRPAWKVNEDLPRPASGSLTHLATGVRAPFGNDVEAVFVALGDSSVAITVAKYGSTAVAFEGTFEGTRTPAIAAHVHAVYVFPGYPFPNAGKVLTSAATAAGYDIADFSFSGTNNSFSPAVVCEYRGRLVYGNFGPGYESHIVFADPFTPAVIGNDVRSANGRSFAVGSRDGDRIVAMIEVTQSEIGSPAESCLLVLKERSAYVITGEPNKTTDTSDMFANMVVSRVAYECGCSSPRTLKSTPYGVFWAGPDDVWFFARGSLPVRVGSKIRPRLEGCNPIQREGWHAEYFDGFYRLAVYGPGTGGMEFYSTPVVGGTPIARCDEMYWLDLRDGPPSNFSEARWWGPQQYKHTDGQATSTGTDGMFVWRGRNTEPVLVAWARGGEPYTVTTFEMDVQSARDCESDTDTPFDTDRWRSLDTSTCEITAELVTKEYDFGMKFHEKLFTRLFMDVWTNNTERFNLETILNGGASVGSDLFLLEQRGFLLDVDSLDGQNLSREFQQLTLYPSHSTGRAVGKTVQFRIYDEPYYQIGADNDEIVILRGGTYHVVTLTQNAYTLQGLLDHICARITAVVGGSCTHDVTGTDTNRNTTITITFASASQVILQNSVASLAAGITTAQTRSCRAVFSLLGYDTSANTASATTAVSSSTVYFNQSRAWDIGGLAIEFDVFTRDPT